MLDITLCCEVVNRGMEGETSPLLFVFTHIITLSVLFLGDSFLGTTAVSRRTHRTSNQIIAPSARTLVLRRNLSK